MRTILYSIICIIILAGLFFFFQKPQQQTPLSSNNNNIPKKTPPTIPPSGKKVFTIFIQDQKIASGPSTLTATQGDVIEFRVFSDQNEEIHLHGYDKSLEIIKNTTQILSFTAGTAGRFPFELEHAQIELGTLEIQPK